MTLEQALVLGIVQGLTEFLPVSSSGHLVLVQALWGVQQPGIAFEVLVHFGTLLAVMVAFRAEVAGLAVTGLRLPGRVVREGWRTVWRQDQDTRLLGWLALGTVPAGLAGLTLKDGITHLFQRPDLVAGMLLVTGLLVWGSDRIGRLGHGRKLHELRWTDGLLIGIAQSLAMIPGISRSGATISAGLFFGVERETAARFSFLLAIPAILGATVLEVGDLAAGGTGVPVVTLVVGTVAAAVAGYAAIQLLLWLVRAARLRYFAYYTWAVGGLLLVTGVLHP